MNRTARFATLPLMLSCPTLLLAQYPSDVVDFNSPLAGPPEANVDMFQAPEYSGSTTDWVVHNSPFELDHNGAYRSGILLPPGGEPGALLVEFTWTEPQNPDSWVRLTTYNTLIRPNPALDVAGKVRFRLRLDTSTNYAEIGLCLGIRETDNYVAQMDNGGVTGPIEWVGVNDTDLSVILPGANGVINSTVLGDDILVSTSGVTAISWGPDAMLQSAVGGDDVAATGFIISAAGDRVPVPKLMTSRIYAAHTYVEFDLPTGTVSLGPSPDSLVPLGGGVTAFTGDGVVGTSTYHWGVLEHLAITVDSTDPFAIEDVRFAIDDLRFEATVLNPLAPPQIDQPLYAADTSVTVTCDPNASEAALFMDGTAIGTAPVTAGQATFTGLSLATYAVLHARQVINGETSAASAPVMVYANANWLIADDFDAYANEAQLNGNWPTDKDRSTVLYAPTIRRGSAASCDGYLSDFSPISSSSARRYRYLGESINPTNTDPLWFSYWHRHTNNNDIGRTRVMLCGYPSGGFELNYWGMFEGAVGWEMHEGYPGGIFAEEYLSVLIDYESSYYFGDPAYINPFGYWGPIFNYGLTGVPRVDAQWHKFQIEVRSTTVNYYIDGVNVNPPAYASGVPRSSSDPFQFVVLGLGWSTINMDLQYDNLTVTRGNISVFPDPLPPAPQLVTPLVPEQASITVSGVDPLAHAVSVYADELLVGEVDPLGAAMVDVAVAALADGAVVVATQTIGARESCTQGEARVGVPPPALRNLTAGSTSIAVQEIHAFADEVRVYINDVLAGTAYPSGEAPIVVNVPTLLPADEVVATQWISSLESPPSRAVVLGGVVINELIYDDTGTDDREFVELYNGGSATVDIGGWHLVNLNGTGESAGYAIPDETLLPSGDFYVLGTDNSLVPNVDQFLGTIDLFAQGQDTLELRTASGAVVDQVTYELGKQLYPAPFEGGIWGIHASFDGTYTSLARYRDGRDTDNNGRDFGTRPQTPGEPNSTREMDVSAYHGPDVDLLQVGDPLPEFHGSYAWPVVIDPAIGNTAMDNPAPIDRSPQGGFAAIFWNRFGPGNITGTNYTMAEASFFDVWIYLDVRIVANLLEEWNIGLAGTADAADHNLLLHDANGSTGIAWQFVRWDQTGLLSLQLLDFKDGGPKTERHVLGEVDLDPDQVATGWHRLGITVNRSRVIGRFDDLEIHGSTEQGILGNFYVGYRETHPSTVPRPEVRPPTLDLYEGGCPGLVAGSCCPASDVDGNGIVNGLDVAIVTSSANFGHTPATAADPCADVDDSGIINGLDVAALTSSACYGLVPPCPDALP